MNSIDLFWSEEHTFTYYFVELFIIMLIFGLVWLNVVIKNPGIPQIYVNRILKELKTGKIEKDLEE